MLLAILCFNALTFVAAFLLWSAVEELRADLEGHFQGEGK